MEERKRKKLSLSNISNSKKFDKDRFKKAKEIQDKSSGRKEKDERFLELKPDKNGKYFAIIRLMINGNFNGKDIIDVYNHHFEIAPKKFFVEQCLTTFGDDCPVCQFNSSIWDENKPLARKQGRRLKKFTNVYVISNPNEPETEGKILLFRVYKAIEDKILEKMNPSNPKESKINVYNSITGCNLKLIMSKEQTSFNGVTRDVPNYTNSEFEAPSRLASDEELDKLGANLYKLEEFFSNDEAYKPKSYENLKDKFIKMGGGLTEDRENDYEDEESKETKEVVKEIEEKEIEEINEEDINFDDEEDEKDGDNIDDDDDDDEDEKKEEEPEEDEDDDLDDDIFEDD